MKRTLLLSLVALRLFAATPVITGVQVTFTDHSVARVTATSNILPSTYYTVIQYGLTSSYGYTLNQGFQPCNNDPIFCPGIYQIGAALSGLAPNTTYHFKIGASADNGSTYGYSSDSTFTTAALPATHPAYPIAPATFSATVPTSFASILTVGTSPGCSTLQACINTASGQQYTIGGNTEIVLAAGSDTHIGTSVIQPPVDGNAVTFTPTNVNAGTGAITVTTPPYGTMALNQGIRFATNNIFSNCAGNCLPGWNASSAFPASTPGALIIGNVYYVVNPSSGCSTSGMSCTFQVAATPSGSPITFSNTGHGTNYVTLYPPSTGNSIVVRTSTPDASFAPPGTRALGSVWASKMAKLDITGGLWNSVGGTAGPLVFQTNIGAHDYYFVGLEITNTDASSLANTSTDPRPTKQYFQSTYSDAPYDIIFDRDYIHGLGFPNRIYGPAEGGFDGMNIAINNSDMENWDYWRPWLNSGTPGTPGFGQTISGSQVTTANGSTYWAGPAVGTNQYCTSSNLSITFTGGSVTGSAVLYFALSPTCTPTYVIPTGMTATCAGTGSDGTNTRACSVLTAASPAFVADSNGSPYGGCAPITTITLASGTPTSVASWGPAPSLYDTEGTQGLIAGWGPGPWQFQNNYLSGAGLLWHFDDSGSGVATPGDYVLRRNTFYMPITYQTGAVGSNNFDYEQRNGVEWKNGQRALIEGNTWANFFSGVTAPGSALTFTPRGYATITDVEVRYNSSTNSNYFMAAIGGLATGGQVAPNPTLRVYAHDNLINAPNGWTQYSAANRGYGGNYPFYIGLSIQDVRVEHNTVYNILGGDPSFLHVLNQGWEGQTLLNNIFFFANDNGNYGMSAEGTATSVPLCSGQFANTLGNLCFTQGPGTPYWLTGGNLLVPYYASTNPPTGTMAASTTVTNWGGSGFSAPTTQSGMMAGSNSGVNFIRGDTTLAARLANIGFTNVAGNNFGLTPSSPYHNAGTDSTDVGMAWLTSQNAQGVVQSYTVTGINSTTATALATTPDTQGCPVDISTDPTLATFTRFAQAGGSTTQSTILTGLALSTTYTVRWDCAVQQPTTTFTTLAGVTSFAHGGASSGSGAAVQ